MSEDNGKGNGDEFNFYFSFTKPLVLDLPSSEDRAIAAAWVQKLETESESEEDKEQRLNYLKLLLFVLQRGRLSGIFKKQPPSGPLQPFPQGFSILDMGNLMLDQDDGQVCGGGDTRLVPYSIEISNDLREFVASQEVPNFGIQMYYAWSSGEPIHKWDSFDEEKFPQFILDKIKQLKEVKSEEKTVGGCVKKKKACDYPMSDKFSKRKVKTPQEVERSQGRSYHTYVGLVRGMGNFNEKCNDDQDRCPRQDQKQGKPQTRNVQRRCPGNGGEAEDMAPEEEYDNFVSGLGGLNAQNKPCLCPYPCHHQDSPQPQQQRGGPQSFEEPPPNGSGRCVGRSGSANIQNNLAVPSPMQTRRRAGEPCPQPESDFTMTPQRCMPTPQSRNNSPNRLNMECAQEDNMGCPPKQTNVCACSSPPCTCPCPRSSPPRSPPSNTNSAMKPCVNPNATVTKGSPKDPRCAARLPGRLPGQYVGNTSTPNSSLTDSSPNVGRIGGNTVTKQELDIIHCYDKRNPDPYLVEKGDSEIPTPSTGGFSPGTPIYMPPTDIGRVRRQLFTPIAQSTFIDGCPSSPMEMTNDKYCSSIRSPRSPELGSHFFCENTPEEVQGPCLRGAPSQLPSSQPPCPRQQPPCPPEQPPCPRQQPPCPPEQPPCPRKQPPCPPEQPPCSPQKAPYPRQQPPCPSEQPPCPRQQPPCPQQQPPCPPEQPPCPRQQPPCPQQQPPCPPEQPPCPRQQPPCPRQQPPCSQPQQQYSPADEAYIRQLTDTYKKPAAPSANKQAASNYAPCGTYATNTSDRLADMANMLQGMKQKTEAHREKCGEGAVYRSPRPEGNAPCYSGGSQSKNQMKSRQPSYDEGSEPGNAQMNTSRSMRGAPNTYSAPCPTPQPYSPREDCPGSVGLQNRGFIQQTPCPPQQMQQQPYSPWQMQQQQQQQLRTPQQMQQSCSPQRARTPHQMQQRPCSPQQIQQQQQPCSPQQMQQQQQPCSPQQMQQQQQPCSPQQMQQQIRSPQQMQQQQPCPPQQMPATMPNQDCYPPQIPDICLEDYDDDSTCYPEILPSCPPDLTQDFTDTTFEEECPSQCGATCDSDEWFTMFSATQSSHQSSSGNCVPPASRSGNRSSDMQTGSCAPQKRSPMQNANNQSQNNAGCRPAANMQYSQMKGGCPSEYSDWPSNSYPEKPNIRYGQSSSPQRGPPNVGNAGASPMNSRTRFLDVSNVTYGSQQQRCWYTGPQIMSPGGHARRLSPVQRAAVNFDDSGSQLQCQSGNGFQEMQSYAPPPQQRCPPNGGQAMNSGGQYDNQMDSREGCIMLYEDDSNCDPQIIEPDPGACFVEFLDLDDADCDPVPARQTERPVRELWSFTQKMKTKSGCPDIFLDDGSPISSILSFQ